MFFIGISIGLYLGYKDYIRLKENGLPDPPKRQGMFF